MEDSLKELIGRVHNRRPSDSFYREGLEPAVIEGTKRHKVKANGYTLAIIAKEAGEGVVEDGNGRKSFVV